MTPLHYCRLVVTSVRCAARRAPVLLWERRIGRAAGLENVRWVSRSAHVVNLGGNDGASATLGPSSDDTVRRQVLHEPSRGNLEKIPECRFWEGATSVSLWNLCRGSVQKVSDGMTRPEVDTINTVCIPNWYVHLHAQVLIEVHLSLGACPRNPHVMCCQTNSTTRVQC